MHKTYYITPYEFDHFSKIVYRMSKPKSLY